MFPLHIHLDLTIAALCSSSLSEFPSYWGEPTVEFNAIAGGKVRWRPSQTPLD